jgi:hypothetical protein
MKQSMERWAFLRTMAQDYGRPTAAGYPWRKLGPGFEPHLRYPLMDGLCVPALFRTRAEAVACARSHGERGRPIRVTISWDGGE